MMKRMIAVMMFVGIFCLAASGTTLSIYQIQYTTNADGSSDWDGQRVDCSGGIVIHKFTKGTHRLFLYDPNNPDGWGGIQVRAAIGSDVNNVKLGDWVSLDNVDLADPAFNELDPNKARGNTLLVYLSTSSYSILSTGNSLPKPLLVDVNDVSVIYDPINGCSVTDHRAEKYEGMYIQVRNISVGDVNLGKGLDNYSLVMDTDPNIYCWASDYMNKVSLPVPAIGQHFCSVSGILEQYTSLPLWDYYQLLTTDGQSRAIVQNADFDGNCDVDFRDLALFAGQWLYDNCGEPDWCGGADLPYTRNGQVDAGDLLEFTNYWLEGTD